MRLAEFLECKGLTLDAVVSSAQAQLCLAAGDTLFLCGSIVEGLGNKHSDLDVYLLTSRTDFKYTSLDAVLLAIDTCLIDVRVVPYSNIEALIARFEAWARKPRQPREALCISYDERKLLHRLSTGYVVFGKMCFEQLRQRVDPRILARHKLDWACYYAETLQVDLAGLCSDGDQYTMVYVAQELLAHAADALLAAHLETNPNGKWRIRQLAELPDMTERWLPGRPINQPLREYYANLHRAPDTDCIDDAHQHALRIVAFSRRAFLWAEQRLTSYEGPLFPVVKDWPVAVGGNKFLPHLDLDVAVRSYEVIELLRLHGSGDIIVLSANTAFLICLFDGQTTLGEAECVARSLGSREDGSEAISQVQALIRYAGLLAEPMLDERILKRLIGG